MNWEICTRKKRQMLRKKMWQKQTEYRKRREGLPLDEDGYLTGSTGCGLCALYRMKQVGITHLKLVGRGNYTDFMEKDIRQLRKALDILEKSDNEFAISEGNESVTFSGWMQ